MALPALTLGALLASLPTAAPASADAESASATTAVPVDSPAPNAKSWQKWGEPREATSGNKCRTYVDAWFDGSKLMSSGAVQCEKDVSLITVFFDAGSSDGRTGSKACRSTNVCYLSKELRNPSGSQRFSAGTNGLINTTLELPPVNIEFST